MEKNDIDEARPFVRRLYGVIYWVLVAIGSLAVIAGAFWLRVAFDRWYIGWLMK